VPALGFLPHLAITEAGFDGNQGLARMYEPQGAGRFIRPKPESRQKKKRTKPMKDQKQDQIRLNVEELEERIAPSTVGALHNNPDNPNNNNDHNAVPKGALPEGT
jgi:hypothetical protein